MAAQPTHWGRRILIDLGCVQPTLLRLWLSLGEPIKFAMCVGWVWVSQTLTNLFFETIRNQ
ncbi:hypothetical protein Patl1_14341 [Pistacia atlantica]|uniref:Uncharacterized protein n=1 Tax=Pistacia atlantica TaxID=434234 RepID=A0ACC1AVZ5_9ROSI|nr:hypothetical protein Patl1_14341 [Pistacia atlantica]